VNRGELQARVCRMLSYAPDKRDKVAIAAINDAINIALQEFAAELPVALLPGEHTVEVRKEYKSSSTLTLSSTADPWVLATPSGTTTADLPLDNTYDGQELEVGDGDTLQRFQVRAIWYASTIIYVALDRPCGITYTNAPFRLRQVTIPFPEDITHILDGYRYRYGGGPIVVHTAYDERVANPPTVYRVAARVSALHRGQHFQVPAPTRAPQATLMDDPDVWVGLEPPGTFVYSYTVGYGWRSGDDATPNGFPQVLWESSPSPDGQEVEVPSSGSSAVKLELPNIAWPVNFDPAVASLRTGKSGLFKLVYRARKTVTGSASTYRTKIEAPDVPQLIAIVADKTTTWVDNGSVTPDPARRRPRSGGYYRYHPNVPSIEDDRFTFRVLRTPAPLLTDQDAVPAVAIADPVILDLAAYRVSLGIGKCLEQGAAAYARWQMAVPKIRAALQHSSGVVTPEPYTGAVSPVYQYGYADWRTNIPRS
jgi:hypothetical protein